MKNLILCLILWSLALGASAVTDSSISNYRLDTGDVIRIHVYGEDDLSLETRIGESGSLNYPYLGIIPLKGVTISDLESRITRGLKGDYLINPSVHISVIEYRPFYIYGEVKTPGGYPYQPGLTVERAIAIAGGMTERAADDRITISRNGRSAKQSLKARMSSMVSPGDTIFVKDSFF